MPSLDIVNQIEWQELDNAINNTRKAIIQRFDFRNTNTTVEVNKKDKKIHMVTADNMKMEALREMFLSAAAKRKLSMKHFDFGELEPGPSGAIKRDVVIREGLERDLTKKIVKMIKETKLKVQPSIQGDLVRLSGKKIDDLRQVMSLLDDADLETPLQYINMKS
jgi:uncharacterized protein YajQ (UPF0234 family)